MNTHNTAFKQVAYYSLTPILHYITLHCTLVTVATILQGIGGTHTVYKENIYITQLLNNVILPRAPVR